MSVYVVVANSQMNGNYRTFTVALCIVWYITYGVCATHLQCCDYVLITTYTKSMNFMTRS